MKYNLSKLIVIFSILLITQTVFADETLVQDFTLPTLTGNTFSLKDHLYKDTIVLNFWAAWCTACAEEMPQLKNLKEKYASDNHAVFVGVNAGDSERAAQKFVDREGYSYLIVMGKDKAVAKAFNVSGLPQTIIISKEGKIIFRGSRPPQSLPE